MATISITRKHQKSLADARAAIERIAAEIAKRFQIHHEWDGNTLHFSRSGVVGQIVLSKGKVKVEAELGFMLMMIKRSIEDEIERHLDQEFG